MLDTRLRSLKGKPIDSTVGTSRLATYNNTRLEMRGGDVFDPNKHRVINLRRIASVIHGCKNANRRQRVWKTSTEVRVLTLISLAGCHLHHKFPLVDSWKQHFILVPWRLNKQLAERIWRILFFFVLIVNNLAVLLCYLSSGERKAWTGLETWHLRCQCSDLWLLCGPMINP